MRIALHDADKTGYPNLALMKISAWHKAQGHKVYWWSPIDHFIQPFNRVYSSKVFTYTSKDPSLPEGTIKGGTGYDITSRLPDEIEHTRPDYSLYGLDYSMGFFTRGCSRKCPPCIVWISEGGMSVSAWLRNLLDPNHKRFVAMDNNILADPHGIRQIEEVIRLGIGFDANQGLDARLIDEPMAKLLAKVNWKPCIRLACDHKSQMPAIERAVTLIRKYMGKKGEFRCYVLIQDDIEDALERINFLMKLGVDPHAQPYRDLKGTKPTPVQRHLARWANTPARKNQSFSAYCAKTHVTKKPYRPQAEQMRF